MKFVSRNKATNNTKIVNKETRYAVYYCNRQCYFLKMKNVGLYGTITFNVLCWNITIITRANKESVNIKDNRQVVCRR